MPPPEKLLVPVLYKDNITAARHAHHEASVYPRFILTSASGKTDIGKRVLFSPPGSLLPRFDRNQFRVGRRTKTAIRAIACPARRLCQNQFIGNLGL